MNYNKRKKLTDLTPPGYKGAGSGNLDKESILFYQIEEIKNMREEINWRVKIAYNASIIFISAITITGGTLFSSENRFLESVTQDSEVMTLSGIAVLIAISAWVGVQNGNHLIEKRIELYTLDLLKTIYYTSNHVFFAWLGFLYGSVFFKNRFKNLLSKFLNASIGLFIYFLPNLVALSIWVYLLLHADLKTHKILFCVASFFLFVAIGSTFFFFFYVVKVNNQFTEFYKSTMKPYLEKNGSI